MVEYSGKVLGEPQPEATFQLYYLGLPVRSPSDVAPLILVKPVTQLVFSANMADLGIIEFAKFTY